MNKSQYILKNKSWNYITILTAFICMLLSFTCCQPEDDNEKDFAYTDNTILMFLPWAGSETDASSLYGYIQGNIKTIENAIRVDKGMNHTRLFVCISTSRSAGALIEVKYNKKTQMCVRDTIDKYEWPTNDPVRIMTERFSKVKSLSPSTKYSLFIGCHGTGWLTRKSSINKVNKVIGGTSAKYSFTAEDLSSALINSGLHPQYILFDACYMANIECAYDLRNCCEHIIASTSELMDYGMPYDRLWRQLSSADPDYYDICNCFNSFYTTYMYPYGTISVINCAEVDQIVEIMKEINNKYDVDLMINDGLINPDNIQKLDGFDKTIFFDMQDYVTCLCKDEALLKRFNQVIQLVSPYPAATPTIFSTVTGSRKYIKVTNYSGITCSDATQSTENNAKESKTHTNWWIATH